MESTRPTSSRINPIWRVSSSRNHDAYSSGSLSHLPTELLRKAKEYGFSDAQLADLLDTDEISIRKLRKERKIEPVFKLVDTCAAEFEAYTPYYYSTYETEDESR